MAAAPDPLWQPRFPPNALPDYDLVAAGPPSSDAGSRVRKLLQEALGSKKTRVDKAQESEDDFIQMAASPVPAAAMPVRLQSGDLSGAAVAAAAAAAASARRETPRDRIASRNAWMKLVEVRCKGGPRPRDASILLHNELITFRDAVGPSREEEDMRKWVCEQVRSVAVALWPESTTVMFGSAATGLSLPDSDVDIVVFGGPKRAIHTLSQTLKSKDLVDYLEVIDKARIPIIKLRLKGCLFTADICFQQSGGPLTGQLVCSVLEALPEARPLILAVKMFLAQRELNETFRGGVGSFLTFLTVISVVQRARRQHPNTAQNLGTLLLSYFEFFGSVLNYTEVGISLLEGGSFFLKQDRQWFSHERPTLLCMENPEKPELDVGRNSWNIDNVRKAFQHAHKALLARMASFSPDDDPAESILASILKLDALTDRELRGVKE